ncbi:MAG TPA: SpoIID/LytB domain-containing protein [Solirubrobacterales bacterium]|nr:SpoIID/LytB domain-containing protein [Solirubrobacterales bacterium]
MPLRRTLLLTALLTALLAPSAGAAVRWVVAGHGFGHGVGMSQYGAYGYAEHGKGYRFILRHYYSGTTIGRLRGTRLVRVLVDISGGDVRFGGATGACGRSLDPRRHYVARRVGRSVQLRAARGRALANCGRKLRAAGHGRVSIDGRAYRGALEVVPTAESDGSLNAVNALPVDQYVKGVVPNESPASWPLAALQAQAVAARSYALADQVGGNGFDLYADTRSQVYGGLESEAARGNRAADTTRGQVVMYGGKVAETFFSACSGGHTESVQNVFFGPPVPYLVGVPDPYDGACPLHSWKLSFSGREISAKLGAHLKGQLKRVVVTRRGASPRIVWAKLYGSGGVSRIRGDQLQAALGAYDRWMSFREFVNGKLVNRPEKAESECRDRSPSCPAHTPHPPGAPGGAQAG